MDKNSSIENDRDTNTRTNNTTSSSSIVWKMLIPLVLAALILIASFSGIFWWQQHMHMEHQIQNTANFVSEEYNRSLEEQTATLKEELGWIIEKHKYVEPLKERNSEELLNTYVKTYLRLNSVHHVTHLYFQGADRVNIVRVHNPDKKGGYIDRYTILEAERTGEITSGVELGSLGTFTLRVVKPVYSNGTLIGYIELGKEIEDILDSVAFKSGSETAVIIHKEKLTRENWENGMNFLGRDGNWDLYPSQVLIYSTMQLPDGINDIIRDDNRNKEFFEGTKTIEVQENGITWHTSVIPLTDASGDEVGNMLIMNDITDERTRFITSLEIFIICSMLIFGILILFFYIILSRTDGRIQENEREIRNSEEKFRNIFEGAVEGIKVTDASTEEFIYVNPALCRMLGYTEEELLQMKAAKIHPNDDLEEALSEFESQKKGEKILLSHIPCIRNDGEIIHTDISVFHAIIDGKKCMVGFYTDVTEIKKINDEMQSAKLAKLAAEESNRLKSEFLANVSHELRTPLNSIIGFSDLILGGRVGEINEQQKKFLGNISSSGKHLLSIINDVLDISKIEAGKMDLKYETFDPRNIIDEVKKVMSPLSDDKELNMEYHIDEELEEIQGDKIRIKQILLNLTSNAIKFTPKGGKVTISAKKVDDKAQFTVKDTGIGISKENQDKLFRPFQQLDSADNRHYEGTGLGLALTKRFVEMHGGRIWLESELEKGSTFTFEIPLETENSAEEISMNVDEE